MKTISDNNFAMPENFTEEITSEDQIPFQLLLTADPSKTNLEKYIFNSSVYVTKVGQEIIGCYALYQINDNTIEIKNIAVEGKYQGRGIGTKLLQDAIRRSRADNFSSIVICTGNSSIGQLYLYQKVGFRITEILQDYFRDNYPDIIIEGGIECRDMIVLTMNLD